MEFQTLYQELVSSTEMIRALIGSIGQEQAQVKPDAESWSILEVICHLYDEEREDFREHLANVKKMGPLDQVMKLIPGAAKLSIPAGQMDPKRMKHVEAIILSMTPAERRNPDLLDGSRRLRIAKGSGRPVAEVNRLMKQFKEMQKFMKQMKGMMGGLGGLPGMGGGLGGMPFGR